MTHRNAQRLAAYRSVATHGGVAAADPHRLTLMLMDGALERIAAAKGNVANGRTADKCALIQRAIDIVHELRGSLDFGAGGELAVNLDGLYDYIVRQLVRANAEGRVEVLDEITRLLGEIRGAWALIPPEARTARRGA
ncbi:MAG: Flagellar secretion chaperone FliS [Steroidobacteraceae bacterium]|nr:Flagellar secretion chaperone FliS [Steroidobacteraceae bacterium]